MSATTLSRADRRRMHRLIADNEATVEADARFFERFPHREYRIRRMSRPEIAQVELSCGGTLLPLPPDTARFTVVKQIASGVRLRVFVLGPGDEDGSDASDAIGALLWERYAEQHPAVREREASFRAALFGPNGPLHDGAPDASRVNESPQSARSRRPGSR